MILSSRLSVPSLLRLCNTHQVLPLRCTNLAHTKPGLLEHLHILERLAGRAHFAQLLEPNRRSEFAPESNVHNTPLGVRGVGFRIVIRGFRVMRGYCDAVRHSSHTI